MRRFVVLVNSMLKNNYTGLVQDKTKSDNFDPYGFGLSRDARVAHLAHVALRNHPRCEGQLILETIDLMFEGGRVGGRDWTKFFVEGAFPKLGTPSITTSGFTHGVNLAQGEWHLPNHITITH